MPWSPAPCWSSEIVVAVLRLVGRVDALGDVGRLLVERDHDAAGVGVEAVLGRGCSRCRATTRAGQPGCRRSARRDLAGDQDRPVVISVSQATRPRGSSAHDGVQHRVRDLVGDLVGVALGDGLRGEDEVGRHRRSSCLARLTLARHLTRAAPGRSPGRGASVSRSRGARAFPAAGPGRSPWPAASAGTKHSWRPWSRACRTASAAAAVRPSWTSAWAVRTWTPCRPAAAEKARDQDTRACSGGERSAAPAEARTPSGLVTTTTRALRLQQLGPHGQGKPDGRLEPGLQGPRGGLRIERVGGHAARKARLDHQHVDGAGRAGRGDGLVAAGAQDVEPAHLEARRQDLPHAAVGRVDEGQAAHERAGAWSSSAAPPPQTEAPRAMVDGQRAPAARRTPGTSAG